MDIVSINPVMCSCYVLLNSYFGLRTKSVEIVVKCVSIGFPCCGALDLSKLLSTLVFLNSVNGVVEA